LSGGEHLAASGSVPSELNSRFLASMRIEVDHSIHLDQTPGGWRRFDVLKGGSFIGPRIRAKILAGGSDIVTRNQDRAPHPDVRLTMETNDGATILITYRGIRHNSEAVERRIAAGEAVPYHEFYLRNAPFFATASEKYDWMNRILSIGVGRREGPMVIYEVFEIL
jgi:Protein of unknown function (DUF3237)